MTPTPQVHIGRWIGRGWDLVTKGDNFWTFVVISLLFFVVMAMLGATCIGGLILYGPLMGAVYFLILELLRTGKLDLNRFQEGMKPFGQLMLSGLVVQLLNTALAFVFVIPISLFMSIFSTAFAVSDRGPSPFVFFLAPIFLLIWLIVFIGSMIIMTLYLFPLLLVLDRKMAFWDAMEESRLTVQRNFWRFFLFTLALQGVNMLGVMACYVGLFISTPVTWCAIVAAYCDIWPVTLVESTGETVL